MNDISSSESIESHRSQWLLAPLAVAGAVAVAAGLASYLRRPSGGSAASARRRQSLIAYLHDHLGGSDVAIGVVRRIAATHEGTEDGALCRQMAKEFEEDRSAVRSVLAQLGASSRSIKRTIGSASGSLLSVAAGGKPGDLSLLRTLEGLAVGVQGKRLLWRSLQGLPALPQTVDGMSFVDLEARAVRQWEAIERRRRALAVRTLSVVHA